MALPERYHIDAVRKLGGDGLVTYPDAHTDVWRLERVFRVDRGTPPASYNSLADLEHPGAKLVEQYIVGGDFQEVEIFQAFEDLPGTARTTLAIADSGANQTTTIQKIVPGSVAPAGGLFVVSDQVAPAQGASSVAIHTRVVVDEQPLLRGRSVDEATGISINYTKQIIDPTTFASRVGLSMASGTYTSGLPHGLIVGDTFALASVVGPSGNGVTAYTSYFVKTVPSTTTFTAAATNGGTAFTGSFTTAQFAFAELQPVSKFKSILIISTVDPSSFPADKTWLSTIRHSFPDIVTDLQVLAATDGAGNYALAQAYTLLGGYAGPCDARFTEFFKTAGGYAAFTPTATTKFIPQGPQYFFYSAAPRIWEFRVPMSLHAAFTPTAAGSTAVFPNATNIPATVPPGYASGDWIVVEVTPEKWRLGTWKITMVEVKVP